MKISLWNSPSCEAGHMGASDLIKHCESTWQGGGHSHMANPGLGEIPHRWTSVWVVPPLAAVKCLSRLSPGGMERASWWRIVPALIGKRGSGCFRRNCGAIFGDISSPSRH